MDEYIIQNLRSFVRNVCKCVSVVVCVVSSVLSLLSSLLLVFAQTSVHRLRYRLLVSIQVICFSLLVYNGFDLISDYLNFDYNYKLDVLDNDFGADYPGISVCTERNTLFDRTKIIDKFNLTQQYQKFQDNVTRIILDERETIDELDED